jgi:hypothetical protein
MRNVGFGLVALGLLLVTTTSGCPWWKDHGPAVKQGVIDCTLDAVKKNAPQFVPAIEAILKGAAPNWKQQLQALITLGKEAAVCAVQVVYAEFKTKSTPSSLPSVSPALLKQQHEAAAVAARALEFLTENKWQIKP